MLLKNYAIAKKAFFNVSLSTSQNISFSPNIIDINGNARPTLSYNAYSTSWHEAALSLRLNTTFKIGTGNTPPTVNDYTLENDVTSSFTQSSYQLSQVITNDGKFETSFKYTAINNTDSSIVIREVGIQKTSSANDNLTYLIFRDLLPNPITVEAGQTIDIIVRISE